MKKTKFIHALLALTLSYGTFASQDMASQYSEYLYDKNVDFDKSTLPPGPSDGSAPDAPDGYTQISYGETPWGKEKTPEYIQDIDDQQYTYVNDKGEMLLYNKYTGGWVAKRESTNADTVNEKYSIGPYAPEPTPEPTTTEDTTTNPTMPSLAISENANVMYSPSVVDISSKENTVSSMQNIGQNAYATNTANLTNSMNITGMDGSDLVNNMTVNTNAMNSNSGSSYNNSTNNITTYTDNNSINDYTTTLDSSRNFEVPAF
jgi:hypothetical protein